jgi:hypothetical protein
MKLRKHLALRIMAIMLQSEQSEDASPHIKFDIDPNLIFFKDDLMYRHNIMRINYTTYDVRRAQDSINPCTDHKDIMLLANGLTRHQYQYARILGIYHANVIYSGKGRHGKRDCRARRMEFLWVRWFELAGDDRMVQQGWRDGRLDALSFRRVTDKAAFGFVDPGETLRACHLIPKFVLGKSRSGDGAKPRSECAQDHRDWGAYYANR